VQEYFPRHAIYLLALSCKEYKSPSREIKKFLWLTKFIKNVVYIFYS
jgi:hypothetical protein